MFVYFKNWSSIQFFGVGIVNLESISNVTPANGYADKSMCLDIGTFFCIIIVMWKYVVEKSQKSCL